MDKKRLVSFLGLILCLLGAGSYWYFAEFRTKYKPLESASGMTQDGFEFFSTIYLYPDGVKVFKTMELRVQPEIAQQEMRRRILNASRIIERTPYLAPNGTKAGERVVLVLEKEHWAAVIWTEGPRLHSIESQSLSRALLFEKTVSK